MSFCDAVPHNVDPLLLSIASLTSSELNQIQKEGKCKTPQRHNTVHGRSAYTLKHTAVLTREKPFYFLFFLFRAQCCSDICFEGGAGAGQVVGGGC